MSILINMEMPKGCLSCFLKYGSCASIRKRIDVGKGDRWIPENYRHDDCPLVQVPPHGRLIDADALEKKFCSHCDDYMSGFDECKEGCFDLKIIKNMPPVIPADKDGET